MDPFACDEPIPAHENHYFQFTKAIREIFFNLARQSLDWSAGRHAGNTILLTANIYARVEKKNLLHFFWATQDVFETMQHNVHVCCALLSGAKMLNFIRMITTYPWYDQRVEGMSNMGLFCSLRSEGQHWEDLENKTPNYTLKSAAPCNLSRRWLDLCSGSSYHHAVPRLRTKHSIHSYVGDTRRTKLR